MNGLTGWVRNTTDGKVNITEIYTSPIYLLLTLPFSSVFLCPNFATSPFLSIIRTPHRSRTSHLPPPQNQKFLFQPSSPLLHPLHVPNLNSLPPKNKKKVQGEAQGPEAAITILLKELNKGPRAAHVVKLEKQEIDLLKGEEGFQTLEDAVRVNGVVTEGEVSK